MPHCDFRPRVFSLRMSHDRKFKLPCVIGPGKILILFNRGRGNSFGGKEKRKKERKGRIEDNRSYSYQREIGNNLELIRFEVN